MTWLGARRWARRPRVVGRLGFVVLAATVVGGGLATAAPSAAAPAMHRAGHVDDFYRVPMPLRHAPRGALIRVQEVGTAAGATTVRVMYHSRDARHRDRAVTGVVTYPTAPAPRGGWPVVAWAHGTTGLASQCAPSRSGAPAPAFGVRGVRVATDYIGLGPVGERHAYLSGVSEANSVVDAVRAARRLPSAHAGTQWVAVGHSQGGHAALFTNQLGQVAAPELHLRGTVAIAPASVLTRTFGPADQVVPRIVGLMALYGLATDYPRIHPGAYVGAAVAARAGVLDTGCLDQITAAFVGIPAAAFYTASPLTTEPARSVVRANDPGRVRVRSPLLLVYGTADTFVVPARVHALLRTLCAVGQVTQLVRVDGADHGTVPTLGEPAIARWLHDRLAGHRRAPDSCAGPR